MSGPTEHHDLASWNRGLNHAVRALPQACPRDLHAPSYLAGYLAGLRRRAVTDALRARMQPRRQQAVINASRVGTPSPPAARDPVNG